MSQATVGMATSYRGAEQCDWLWHQTPHPQGVWGNVRIDARHPQPDFLLLYQFDFPAPAPPPTLKDRLRGVKHRLQGRAPAPPENLADRFRHVPRDRCIYLLREPPLDEVVETNRRNYREAQQWCAYVSGPDDDAPTPDYMPAIWYVGNAFRELNEMPPPEKTRPCSWITSGINRTENHRRRLAFLRAIAESGLDCDRFGRGLPDWAAARGELKNKWHGMAPYRYNLAIENYADNDWYVSEKLWDSLLSWCLPIYYGGPAADKLLPPGSFLRLPALDESGLAYIREVTASPDAWYDAKDAIAEARQIILHRLNLANWLSEFVARQ